MRKALLPHLLLVAASLHGQAPTEPLHFDLAAVHQNQASPRSDPLSSNVPLGPGDVFTPTQGVFRAHNVPLLSFIAFAYRFTDAQYEAFRDSAPHWVAEDRFDIEARSENTAATKDQFRLMVRTLLAERFRMAAHYESHTTATFALGLAKPGSTGPRLRAHLDSAPCPKTVPTGSADGPPPPETIADGYPYTCGAIVLLPSSSRHPTLGGRAITLKLLSDSLAGWGELGRPVVDHTGLTGLWDFRLDWTPQPHLDASDDSATLTAPDGLTFRHALERQLGLVLESEKNAIELLLLDHIDPLTEN